MAQHLPTIKLDQFEGPFDLLLELARKRQVNLSEISLRTITDDFLSYISAHTIPALIQGDFLVVAATLALLKIRSLLPNLTPEEEEEISSLTDRVRAYQLYRQQAENFQKQWGELRLLSGRFWSEEKPVIPTKPLSFPTVTSSDLQHIFASIVQKLPKAPHPRAHLVQRGRSLIDWLQLLETRLSKVRTILFQKTLKGSSPQDTAISFLAVLELARKQTVVIEQTTPFSEITIARQV
ncbi:MAG: segregation/condensation protein A [Candidatus Andersenbacteria bacterium]|nr:segregation/condensation protein A [Candidatus Andersenbacteria bacterium]MBI3250302.1 segregation/condensation protein A [Candidatus Andersenbacteria bacterium]